MSDTNNNIGRIVTNTALASEELETASLKGLQFDYKEAQFIIAVNGNYEKIIKSNLESEIYFETESLKITADVARPTNSISIKNKTKKTISYTINILPWSDPYQLELKTVKDEFESFSANLMQKLYPVMEYVPSNIPATFVHNTARDASEFSISIFDYSTDTILSRPLYGKFTDGEFNSDILLLRKNSANPKNAIDVEFKGNKKPKNCILRLEGRHLLVEILDFTQKIYTKTNKNLASGTSENINHNLDIDPTSLPIKLKVDYTVKGKIIPVPGNRPRDLKFILTPQAKFVYIFNEGHLVGDGNLVLSIDKDSPSKVLGITNNIDMSANLFEKVGYTIEVTQYTIGLNVTIELN